MASADTLRAAHASLPYAVCDGYDNVIVNIVDGKANHFVATCHAHAAPDLHGNNTAAFIVRACNAHYQMLEALQDALACLEATESLLEVNYRLTLPKVRAAIAAAESGAGR